MDLAEFVEETLTEILTGIRAAQQKEGGQEIAAEMLASSEKLGVIGGGPSGLFTIVQFDVSVVAETKAGGKGGLKVWTIGVEGSGEHMSQNTSRVKFSVHLRLPQGSKAPKSSFNRDLKYGPIAD